jgi:hypothetical protein
MSRAVMQQALEALEDLIEAGAEDWGEQRPCVRIGREVATALREALEQPEQEPVAFPSRRAVERAIESVENPKGIHLNDGKERVILPGGTLRYMLALIDHASPPRSRPLPPGSVREMMDNNGYNSASPQEQADFINGVRHSENQHGITGDIGEAMP